MFSIEKYSMINICYNKVSEGGDGSGEDESQRSNKGAEKVRKTNRKVGTAVEGLIRKGEYDAGDPQSFIELLKHGGLDLTPEGLNKMFVITDGNGKIISTIKEVLPDINWLHLQDSTIIEGDEDLVGLVYCIDSNDELIEFDLSAYIEGIKVRGENNGQELQKGEVFITGWKKIIPTYILGTVSIGEEGDSGIRVIKYNGKQYTFEKEVGQIESREIYDESIAHERND